MTDFKVGDIVLVRDPDRYMDEICQITNVTYTCRGFYGQSSKVDGKDMRAATPAQRAQYVAAETEKLDAKIKELLAYRKQLEDGIN